MNAPRLPTGWCADRSQAQKTNGSNTNGGDQGNDNMVVNRIRLTEA
jgi:hypothetical protein